jgi:hypothetical protein
MPTSTQLFRQYVLDAGARHRPGRKGVALDDRRGVRQHRLDVQRLQPAAVERDWSGKIGPGTRPRRWQKMSSPPV